MANQQPGLLGQKLGMTQLFESDGAVVPVTVVQVGPCRVLQVKTADSRDGYNALQLGWGTQKPERLRKPLLGHYAKSGEGAPRWAAEIRVTADEAARYTAGQTVSAADLFESGGHVDVTGTSKGRGFAGVMKRHHFRGFIRTHGTHEYFRHGGSIGTNMTPGRTLPGLKMGGQYGNETVTAHNLKVAKILPEDNLVLIEGAVPGPKNGIVFVRGAVKKHGGVKKA